MMTFEYDADNSIIHLKASGVLEADDPINYFRLLDEDPSFKPKAEERVYLANVENFAIKYSDAVRIRDAFKEYGHAEKLSSSTLIADSDLSFGVARMVMSTLAPVFDKFTVLRTDNQPSESVVESADTDSNTAPV